jgi:hypothetical protein
MVAQRRHKMKRLSSVLMFMAIGVLAAGFADATVTPTVSGIVKDTSGKPMSYAQVTAYCDTSFSYNSCPTALPQMAQTDANGYYNISIPGGLNSQGWWFVLQVVPSYTLGMTGTFTPASMRANMGTIPGYVVNATANFTGTPGHLQSGEICYESSCGEATIANVCSLCPNGSKAINNNRKIYCSNGLMSTIVENVCN